MKPKLIMLALITLNVLVTWYGSAYAGCSGDDCLCYVDAAACRNECTLEPPEYQLACAKECMRISKACGIACCGGSGTSIMDSDRSSGETVPIDFLYFAELRIKSIEFLCDGHRAYQPAARTEDGEKPVRVLHGFGVK